MFFQWFFTVGPLVSMVFPMVFPFETMVSQWFFTLGPLVSMVFHRFPMVANHWSNDGMVTIHRYGLLVYVWAVINDHRCFCDLWSVFVSSSMSEPLSWVWLPPGVHGLFVQDCAPSDMRNMYLMCWSLKWWLRDGCVIVLLIGGRLWILRFSAILTSL